MDPPTNISPMQRFRFNDSYLLLLAFCLCGYAVLGKGFAYLGVPPLFIGEILLVLGVVALLKTGCWIAVLTSLPSILLALLMLWVWIRTLPFVGFYGFDALRDSVIASYGMFAFIVMALLIERPARFGLCMRYILYLLFNFGQFAFLIFAGSKLAAAHSMLPTWPNSGFPLLLLRPGEVAVHLAASAIAALLGLIKVGPIWTIALVCGIGLIATQSRGALVAFLVPVILAAIAAKRFTIIIKLFLIGSALTFSSLLLPIDLEIEISSRPVNIEQVTANFTSILSESDAGNLDDTKRWRMGWWTAIQNYTFHGPYFWSGKGFGVNLAEVDGFVIVHDLGGSPVRSPHNIHMTFLARGGVPALTIWGALLLSWLCLLMRSLIIARRHSDHTWSKTFLFFLCYLTSIIIDASFDVALEGPMLGIWFWTVFGIGVGASMIYEASLIPRPGESDSSQSQSP